MSNKQEFKIHELSITENILETVLQKAREHKAKKIIKINLKIGEMTMVVPDCIRFYFEILSKGTVAEGAALEAVEIPLTAQCKNCAKKFAVENYVFRCPYCKSPNVEIISGRELFIESIEVDSDENKSLD